MIEAVIIDDEESGRDTLAWLLETYCPQVKIQGMSDGVEVGVTLIEQEKPQLLFLDINLTQGTGFDILKKLKWSDFHVIFVTAYNDYAIEAFEHSASHYLLKPVSPEKLIKAVNRVTQYQDKRFQQRSVETLLENLSSKDTAGKKIMVPTQKGFELIRIVDITRFKGDGNYTKIHQLNGETFLSSKGIREYESMLVMHRFFRIHKSHLINLNYVKNYIRGRGGQVVMEDGSTLEVSRNKKIEFLDMLNPL
jgi:two-component system LytT family response regulator